MIFTEKSDITGRRRFLYGKSKWETRINCIVGIEGNQIEITVYDFIKGAI